MTQHCRVEMNKEQSKHKTQDHINEHGIEQAASQAATLQAWQTANSMSLAPAVNLGSRQLLHSQMPGTVDQQLLRVLTLQRLQSTGGQQQLRMEHPMYKRQADGLVGGYGVPRAPTGANPLGSTIGSNQQVHYTSSGLKLAGKNMFSPYRSSVGTLQSCSETSVQYPGLDGIPAALNGNLKTMLNQHQGINTKVHGYATVPNSPYLLAVGPNLMTMPRSVPNADVINKNMIASRLQPNDSVLPQSKSVDQYLQESVPHSRYHLPHTTQGSRSLVSLPTTTPGPLTGPAHLSSMAQVAQLSNYQMAQNQFMRLHHPQAQYKSSVDLLHSQQQAPSTAANECMLSGGNTIYDRAENSVLTRGIDDSGDEHLAGTATATPTENSSQKTQESSSNEGVDAILAKADEVLASSEGKLLTNKANPAEVISGATVNGSQTPFQITSDTPEMGKQPPILRCQHCTMEASLQEVEELKSGVSFVEPGRMSQQFLGDTASLPSIVIRSPVEGISAHLTSEMANEAHSEYMDLYHECMEKSKLVVTAVSTQSSEAHMKQFLEYCSIGATESRKLLIENSECKLTDSPGSRPCKQTCAVPVHAIREVNGVGELLPSLGQDNLFWAVHFRFVKVPSETRGGMVTRSKTGASARGLRWKLVPVALVPGDGSLPPPDVVVGFMVRKGTGGTGVVKAKNSERRKVQRLEALLSEANPSAHKGLTAELHNAISAAAKEVRAFKGDHSRKHRVLAKRNKYTYSVRLETYVARNLWEGFSKSQRSELMQFTNVMELHISDLFGKCNQWAENAELTAGSERDAKASLLVPKHPLYLIATRDCFSHRLMPVRSCAAPACPITLRHSHPHMQQGSTDFAAIKPDVPRDGDKILEKDYCETQQVVVASKRDNSSIFDVSPVLQPTEIGTNAFPKKRRVGCDSGSEKNGTSNSKVGLSVLSNESHVEASFKMRADQEVVNNMDRNFASGNVSVENVTTSDNLCAVKSDSKPLQVECETKRKLEEDQTKIKAVLNGDKGSRDVRERSNRHVEPCGKEETGIFESPIACEKDGENTPLASTIPSLDNAKQESLGGAFGPALRPPEKVEWFFDDSEPLPKLFLAQNYPRDPELGLHRVGITTYLNLFTESEMVQAEQRTNKMFKDSQEKQFRPMTAHHTLGRNSRVSRTKLFFNARYLWTRAQLMSRDAHIARGIRCDVSKVPVWIPRDVEKRLVDHKVLPLGYVNSYACNIYHDGSEGLGQHFDDQERFDQPIFSVRLFSDSRLSFGCKLYGFSNGEFTVPMPRGSSTVLEKGSYASTHVKHCIRPCDMTAKSGVLLFRHIHNHLLEEAAGYERKTMQSYLESMDLSSDVWQRGFALEKELQVLQVPEAASSERKAAAVVKSVMDKMVRQVEKGARVERSCKLVLDRMVARVVRGASRTGGRAGNHALATCRKVMKEMITQVCREGKRESAVRAVVDKMVNRVVANAARVDARNDLKRKKRLLKRASSDSRGMKGAKKEIVHGCFLPTSYRKSILAGSGPSVKMKHRATAISAVNVVADGVEDNGIGDQGKHLSSCRRGLDKVRDTNNDSKVGVNSKSIIKVEQTVMDAILDEIPGFSDAELVEIPNLSDTELEEIPGSVGVVKTQVKEEVIKLPGTSGITAKVPQNKKTATENRSAPDSLGNLFPKRKKGGIENLTKMSKSITHSKNVSGEKKKKRSGKLLPTPNKVRRIK